MNEQANEKEIDDLIRMIEGKMDGGVSRLKVDFSEQLEEGKKEEKYHLGRCDVGSPWAKGTVRNSDATDCG